jgi:chromosome segregation ATPase
METIEEEMKKLEKENKPLEIENEELARKVKKLEDASFGSPETSGRLEAKLGTAKEKYHELKDIVERQKQQIEVAQPRLRAALEKSEREKSLLEHEVEALQQEIKTLDSTLKQTQLQRQKALDSLTTEERYIYDYVVQHKGTVNIGQLMKITGHTADDIFRLFEDLKSKGLIG